MTAPATPPRLRRKNHGRGHSYYVGDRKLDGVTSLIGDGMAHKALMNWAGDATAAYAVNHWNDLARLPIANRLKEIERGRYKDRDEAGNRGKEVHRLAEALVQHREVVVPDEIAGHVDSYVQFLDDWKIRAIAVEVELFHLTWRYAGTADLVAELPSGRRLFMDIKTSRSGIFGDVALQLAAYSHAEIALLDGVETPVADLGADSDVSLAIHVRSDGYSVFEIPTGPEIFQIFCHVVKVARADRDVLRTLVGDPISPVDLDAATLEVVA